MNGILKTSTIYTHANMVGSLNILSILSDIIRNCLIIVLAVCLSTSLFSQSFQPSFRNYSVDDGLPSSEVYVATQDDEGYMWFGTDNGLSRFDGYEFKNYGPKDGLMNSVIFDLKVDTEGKLWILTMSGNIYIHEDNEIRSYEFNNLITQYNSDYILAKTLKIYDENKIRITLQGFGIISIDATGNIDLKKFPKDHIIIYDREEYFSFSTTMGQINMKEFPFKDSLDSKSASDPIYIYGPKDTIINFSLHQKNHLKRKDTGLEITKISENEYLVNYLTNSLIKDGKISWIKDHDLKMNDILNSENGSFWLGMHNKKGIREYQSSDDLESNIAKTILPTVSVSRFYSDNKDGIWVTTLENGVYYCPNINISEIFISELLGTHQHISGISFSDNELYIGKRNNLQYSINLESNSIKIIAANSLKRQAYSDFGHDIYYSLQNNILIGGGNNIAWHNGNWKKIEYTSGKIIGIKKISSNEYKNKVLTTFSSTIYQIDIKNLEINTFSKPTSIRTFYANFDKEGNRWIGKENGLHIWAKDSIYMLPNTPQELTKRIEDIQFLSNNDIALGTKGDGVIIWDKEKIKYKVTTDQGLSSDMIENIYVDSLDIIWVGTLNGLNRVTIENDSTINVKQFTKKHGIPGNEITDVKRRGDHIWVATTTGLGRIKDSPANTNTTIPIIKKFAINNKRTIPQLDQKFQHNENNITIDYVALDYKAHGDILYRYKFHKEDNWQETKNTSLNLAGLAAEDYQLEIQAQNEDGFWSPSLAIPFTILRPFYLRTWFLILGGLLSAIGIYSYTRRKQQQEIDSLKKEHEIASQITELERSALQAQMNPHFIFNILNSIHVAINENEKDKAGQLLSKFAKLIRATLKNAKAKTISLEEEIGYIESYLYMEQVRHKAFEYSVDCDPELDVFETYIPPMLVQPFVENAIKYGASDNDDAMIAVCYSQAEDNIMVSIKDNGKGFQEKSSNHKSMGMSITQRRLDLLNVNGTSEDTLTINQLKDENRNITGTEIVLKINMS